MSFFRIIEYDEAYRDDMIYMVLQAKDALGRKPRLNADLLDVKANYTDKDDMFWLALDENDRVIGCGGYSRTPGTNEAFVHRLYVKAGEKRRGIGSALLEKIESAMKAHGITVSRVHLGEPFVQWFESYAFYPKHGYEEYAPRYMMKELASELWDAYDKDFHKVEGVMLVRSEPIPDGLRHLVCEVIVRHTDGEYLLMRRDLRKMHGGMWEATAGGSAFAGEEPYGAAKRELFEETGIASENLTQLGTIITDKAVYAEFLCETDCDKSCVTLQEGETVAHRWVTRGELLSMKSDELLTHRILRFIPELNNSADEGGRANE